MRHKVMIMRCSEYDSDRIAGILKEGLRELGAVPSGKTMLKPNAVVAHREVFPHAFTRPEFLDGALKAVRGVGRGITELSVGERSGITIPTRYCFKNAGYYPVIKKHRAKARHFDEERHVPVRLSQPGRLRDEIWVPKPVADCDFLINLPKFKAHPWSRITLSLKNYIGIQDDRYRLVDHNSFLEHKIADLQEVIAPKFIAIDGITAGQKMMLTPTPFPLGAIVMGVNPCAVDTVGCHMVHCNPEDVKHLRLASERGIGPITLDEIEVVGDFPLEEVRARTREFQFCMERVDDYYRDSKAITCTVGKFPEKHSEDYCWGGCPGALQEAMHINAGFLPDVDNRMKKIHYVVGHVEGPLQVGKDERVLFVGSCTRYKGSVNGYQVDIKGDYRTTAEIDASRPKSNDMILKILGAKIHSLMNMGKKHVHVLGCPVSVAQHVTYLSALGKIPDVNFDKRFMIGVNVAYWQMRINRFLKRFLD
ncbi:MAG: DUF362 domain-containing protein [Desulfomonilaceae bacterium]